MNKKYFDIIGIKKTIQDDYEITFRPRIINTISISEEVLKSAKSRKDTEKIVADMLVDNSLDILNNDRKKIKVKLPTWKELQKLLRR